MQLVQWGREKNVAVITMCNSANRQNLDFAQQMNACFDQILEETSITSIVLTSSDEKNFSQGVDIEWLMQKFGEQDFTAVKAFMYEMNTVFKRLLLLPLPVIAAINGHAFGNGAIISCACDFRFMTKDKGYFCFPEVDVNIPFLPGMIAFVRKAIPEYYFNELLLTGKRATAVELEANNVITLAANDRADLYGKAIEYAESFTKQRPIFGELKRRKHKEIIQIIEKEDPEYIEPLNLMMQ